MVSSRQSSQSSFLRDAWVEVDLAAIEHNVAVVNSWIKRPVNACRLMAVVKSDAYGHGAPSVAEVLSASGADCFGVASVDEGSQLRASGIEKKIVILSPAPFWALENAIANKLDLTITSLKQAQALDIAARKADKQASVHIKVDSGMHRLGIDPRALNEILDFIDSAKALELQSVFSHLAKAGDRQASLAQFDVFSPLMETIRNSSKYKALPFHLASSEATRSIPDIHLDMVRVGLYLYGLEPRSTANDLKPAMSVRGRINHIGSLPEGESAGYNGTWTATRPSRLASIPIGYADGVDRRLSNQMAGTIFGKSIKQVGLISMDQMMFDITDLPEAEEGDVITLIGPGEKKHAGKSPDSSSSLKLCDWASSLDTITYELACRLRARLPRIYTRPRPSSPSDLKSMNSIL
ncbi:MAG: alanine racemase [Candidatus Obscuribacterales bacterium]|nr:alanine racemase [Candidatus Obscuribacterales bacterium]